MVETKDKIAVQMATALRIESLNERFSKEILLSRKKASITTSRRQLHTLWTSYQDMHLEIYGEQMRFN